MSTTPPTAPSHGSQTSDKMEIQVTLLRSLLETIVSLLVFSATSLTYLSFLQKLHDVLIRCLGPDAPYLGLLEDHYSKAKSRENRIMQTVTKDVLTQLQEMVESEVSKQLAKMRNGVGPEASPIPAMPLFSCSPQQFTSIHNLPTIAADDADNNPWQDAAGEEVPAVRKAASAQAGVELASAVDGESATATAEQAPVINRHLAPPTAKLSHAPEQPPSTFQASQKKYIHRVLGALSIPTPIRIYKDREPSSASVGTLFGTIVHHATVRPIIVLVDAVAKNPQLVLICALFMFLISVLTTVGIIRFMFCEIRHPSRNLPYSLCLSDYQLYRYW